MAKLTHAELEDLTGLTFKTIKKRLEGIETQKVGQKSLVDSATALKMLYASKSQNSELCLEAERAKLARAQTNKIELETQILREQYLDKDELTQMYGKILVEFKDHLRGLPLKIAGKLAGQDQQTIFSELGKHIDEALITLAGKDIFS